MVKIELHFPPPIHCQCPTGAKDDDLCAHVKSSSRSKTLFKCTVKLCQIATHKLTHKNLLHQPFIIITSSSKCCKARNEKVNEISNFDLGTLGAILMQFIVFVEVRHFMYRLHPNSYMNLVQFWMLEQCVSLQKLAPQMIF